jgi:predicted transposase YdaD
MYFYSEIERRQVGRKEEKQEGKREGKVGKGEGRKNTFYNLQINLRNK